MDDALDNFEAFRTLTEKDIVVMAKSFGKRTTNDGQIHFGTGRTKQLQGLMHWVHDRFRCSEVPHHLHFTLNDMNESIKRAATWKVEYNQVDTVSQSAIPSKLECESQWSDFEAAFSNYLSIIPGVFGVPLSYVIREMTYHL